MTSELYERLAGLPMEKQRLLLRQIEREGGAAGLFVTSFAQQRLWFLDQLAPGGPLYNMPAALRFGGRLDWAALVGGVGEIVRRHESLRTTFQRLADQPVQLVSPPGPPRLLRVDLDLLPAARREAEARRLVADEGRAPFDLRRGPLLRLVLLRLDDASHVLLLTLHHIVADGWSIGVFFRELAALYDAFRGGRTSPLPELAFQYRDFARWQRRWLQGERLESEIAHWRERLAGAPPEMELPHDRARPAMPSFRGSIVPLALSPVSVHELRALGARQGATLFMTLLAAFEACLHHHGGQTDQVLGTVVANRDRAELEGLIGILVNTLVLRTDLGGDPPFGELLRRVQQVTLDAYGHQDLPFEKLVEALHPERSVNRSPLFQVVFDLQNLPTTGEASTEISTTGLDVQNGTAKFDLRLALQDTGESLSGGLEFATDLFDRTTLKRLAAHLERVVAAVVRDPGTPISALGLAADSERHQMVFEWNDSAAKLPEATVHGLFAAAARRTPRAIAAIAEIQGGARITYAELDRQAERLAGHLAARGVGPGAIVGLWLERSLEMLVALLATLKAGAAYLPLDAANPPERLALVVADAGVAAFVTREGLRAGLPAGRATVLCLDAGWEGSAAPVVPLPTTMADHPAYLIYTSGSTGHPKGVLVPHRGLVNYLLWAGEAYGAAAGSGSLVHSPFSFDLTLTGLLAPLIVGGTVRLLRESEDPEALARALRGADDLSLVKLTPAHLEILRHQLRPDEIAGCARTFVLGGEALTGENLAYFRQHASGLRLVNEYGPTETVVGCSVHELDAGEPLPDRVPIGRPIANLRLYVLDRALAPAPLGASGELYIGGVGVARGYLGRPDLTAERFVPDPFSPLPGGRLYRSGDLGRLRADGTLLCLGRTDHQIKVRGFRIEVGEIEAALLRSPLVETAAVVADGEGTRERRLLGFVVPRPGARVTERELKSLLEGVLPRYMIPSSLHIVEGLPQTPNGKLDRSALLGLSRRSPPGSAGAVPSLPATELERTVAAIWREVLGRDEVGLDDNFFDLGGHSLMLTEVHRRLGQAVPLDLPLLDLFNHPTVRSLGGHLAHLSHPAGEPKRAERYAEGPRWPSATSGAARETIAIVGMALRVPGASNPEELWRNLRDGVEGVTFFTSEELLAAGVDPALVADPRYVRGKASLAGVELFDAPFFHLTRRQAEVTDPQNRIFLECAWEALEDAGQAPGAGGPTIGLFAGKGVDGYAALLQAHPASVAAAGPALAALGNEKDHLAPHTAYLLGLEGPAVTVQTSCSTSLVAIHLACQSLLAGDCELALAGGSSIDPQPCSGYLHLEGGILSPDGHCRPFDASAGGTVGGSGAAVVVLKRLSEALRDGDTIRGVLLGSAINNDGAQKVGYTAPRIEGQAGVIRAALRRAGVEADDISYVEAHGTGTEMGDPIEIAALTRAFRESTERAGFCAVGSLKSNLGHLDTAAGAAGLIKTVLALQNRELPKSLHFQRPNPRIDFAASPFYVNAEHQPWEAPAGPRRAGVSSFGIGGTNAHAVLEEAPPQPPSGPARPSQLLLLSARTESALEATTDRLKDHLESHPEVPLADVAFTLQVGRKLLTHRRAVVCADRAAALAALATRDPERVDTLAEERQDSSYVLLFPGHGVQYPEMGRELYESEALFRETVDRSSAFLAPLLGLDLRDLLYPRASEDGAADKDGAAEALLSMSLGQPALFVVEYAMARLLLSWIGPPAAMLGHSTGEYVAACLAGVLTLEDALTLVTLRGQLFEETSPGAMLAVPLRVEEIPFPAGGGLSVAATNGPSRTIVSGSPEAVAELEAHLRAAGLEVRRLHADHAFHSPAMQPIVDRFLASFRGMRLGPPSLPYLSNVSGDWARAEQVTEPRYWAEHMLGTVRFNEGLEKIWQATDGPLVEAGPGRTLASLALQHPARPSGRAVLSTLRRLEEGGSTLERLLGTLGRLCLAGVRVDWTAFQAAGQRHRVPLPTYPFERQTYWFSTGPAPAARPGAVGEGRFLAPTWRRAAEASRLPAVLPAEIWLVFLAAEDEPGSALVRALEQRGAQVVTVVPGPRFAWRSESGAPGAFTVEPTTPEDYQCLLHELAASHRLPQRVVQLWAAGPLAEPAVLRSLLLFASAFGAVAGAALCRVGIVTDRLHAVLGGEEEGAAAGLLLGLPGTPLPVAPGLTFEAFDLALSGPGRTEDGWTDALLATLLAPPEAARVALRGRHRWLRSVEPIDLAPALVSGARDILREQGVYLITGDLGPASFGFAQALARRSGARIALTSSTELPPREEWPARLAGEPGPATARSGDDRLDLSLARETDRLRTLEAELDRALEIRVLADYEGLVPALDRLCSAHVLDYFRASGIDLERVYDRGELRRALRIQPQFEKFLAAFLTMLAEDGLLAESPEGLRFLPAARVAPSAGELRRDLDRRFPEQRGLYRLLEHCASHYGPALSGEIPALGVLYPEGRSDLLDSIDRETAPANHEELYLRLLAQLVAGLAPEAGGRPLRILEVGGGSGALTRRLLGALTGRRFEYVFTDLGKAFVRQAELEAAQQSLTGIRFQLFDISRDPEVQGLSPYSFDVVVGLNVVHATPDLGATVENLRQLLVPGGLLGLIETVRPSRWVDLIWGLAEGWWYFEDRAVRERSPLADLSTWEGVLRDGGFADVALFPREEPAARRQDIGLILGQQSSLLADPRYLQLDAERRRLREAAERASLRALLDLEAAGAEVAVLFSGASAGGLLPEAATVAAVLARFGALHGLVHVAVEGSAGGGAGSPVEPAFALSELLAGRALDFSVVSVSAVAGAELPIADRAAQAVLGVFAERQAARGNGPFTLLRWTTGEVPLETAEEVLGRLLAHRLPEITVTLSARELPEADGEPRGPVRATVPRAAPESEVEGRLAAIWRDLLGVEVGRHDNFFELGGDSLVALNLTSRLRDAFGVEIPMRRVLEGPSVAELAALIEASLPRVAPAAAPRREDLPPTLVEIQPGDRSRLPFFTVHAAGGNVLCYYSLARHLGKDRPVYALQAPGLEGEERGFSRIEDLAAHHVQAVRSAQPRGPYLLGGWSAGGTIAFEMAQQLQQAGEEILLVALMDTYSPKSGEHLDDLRMLLWQAVRFRMPMTIEELTRFASYEERLDHMIARAREGGLIPPEVDAVQAHRLLATELRTLQAILNYRPTMLDARLAFFRCLEGTDIGDFEQLFPHVNQLDHPAAWREYSTEPMTVYDVPGDHSVMMEEPSVQVLAERLGEAISEIETAATV